jgi:ribose 1,5-bisphosphokinase
MSGGEGRRLPEAAPAAGGALILIVGPSGAGKDTLLDAAKAHFEGDRSLAFWQRVITRADQTGERHIVATEAEFSRVLGEGGFFLAWEAHGLKYGVGLEILDVLRSGGTVVASVSRQIIAEARAKWPRTHVIHVTAREAVRRERLLARGRESRGGIDERLARGELFATPDADWLIRLDNSGALADGAARFVGLIARLAKL